MLRVVSNTTPIISLLKIGKLSILKDLYGEIYIPKEVFTELEKGKGREYIDKAVAHSNVIANEGYVIAGEARPK